MCTAVTYLSNHHYFGRNLDFEHSFGEKIVITSREFPFSFREMPIIQRHYALIGMGIISDNFPLYFDGVNEKGLSMAGLLFPGHSYFHQKKADYKNIASFEFIPWVLSQCQNIDEAKKLLRMTNITDENFNSQYPVTPLHWIIADRSSSIIVESIAEGLFIYDNPTGVLTNSPTFPQQIAALEKHCKKEGSSVIPGDLSSTARFVRAALTRENSFDTKNEQSSVNQFYHILDSTFQSRGCNKTKDNLSKITYYSSCINTDKGIYYYTTYDNRNINAVNMYEQNLDSDRIYTFPLITEWSVNYQR